MSVGDAIKAEDPLSSRSPLRRGPFPPVLKTHLSCVRSPISTHFQEFTSLSVALGRPHLQVIVHQNRDWFESLDHNFRSMRAFVSSPNFSQPLEVTTTVFHG
jgi:hypothetical protein